MSNEDRKYPIGYSEGVPEALKSRQSKDKSCATCRWVNCPCSDTYLQLPCKNWQPDPLAALSVDDIQNLIEGYCWAPHSLLRQSVLEKLQQYKALREGKP